MIPPLRADKKPQGAPHERRDRGEPVRLVTMRLIIGAVGICSFIGLGVYDAWLKRALRKGGPATV